jgi:hypothetical protein
MEPSGKMRQSGIMPDKQTRVCRHSCDRQQRLPMEQSRLHPTGIRDTRDHLIISFSSYQKYAEALFPAPCDGLRK